MSASCRCPGGTLSSPRHSRCGPALAADFALSLEPRTGGCPCGDGRISWPRSTLSPWCRLQLTRYHVNAFHTRTNSAAGTRQKDMAELQVLFGQEKIRDQIPTEARDAFARRLPGPKTSPEGGYSAGELDRLTAAARADTAWIVRRIRAA